MANSKKANDKQEAPSSEEQVQGTEVQDRGPAPAEAAPSEVQSKGELVLPPSGSAAPATQAPAESNPFTEYGNQISSRNIVGDLLKFNKGEYLAGQDEDEVPIGTQMIANMDQLLIGWIRWQEKKPEEQRMGLLVDGYHPPKRDTLGFGFQEGMKAEDADQTDWEEDTNKVKRDPWQFSNYLVMKDFAEKDPQEGIYTFATSSSGGLNAIADLCKVYGRKMREHPNEYPVVALKVGSYKHAEWGKVHVPVFIVTGWAPKSSFADNLATNDITEQLAGEDGKTGEDIPF